MQNKPDRIIVIGCGLIGGSIVKGIAKRKVLDENDVVAVDADASTRVDLSGYTNQVFAPEELEQACKKASLVLLCASPHENQRLMQRLWEIVPPGSVITDVGSVKSGVCDIAGRLPKREGIFFVPGHPMAGNEGAGFRASQADLFMERPWSILPAPEEAVKQVSWLINSLGGRIVQLPDAETHDREVALVSHLMYVVSRRLSELVKKRETPYTQLLAGPGYDSMLRLAHSDSHLWQEILTENESQVVQLLTEFADT